VGGGNRYALSCSGLLNLALCIVIHTGERVIRHNCKGRVENDPFHILSAYLEHLPGEDASFSVELRQCFHCHEKRPKAKEPITDKGSGNVQGIS
jgi:hypothetical protein